MTIYYSDTTKGFYDTEVVELVNYGSDLPNDLIEITKETRNYLLTELNSNNKIIVIVDNEITLQDRVYSWEDIRMVRNLILLKSDYTQLPDFPEAKKQEWAVYRQTLRDIPQTYSNTQDIIWPTEPV